MVVEEQRTRRGDCRRSDILWLDREELFPVATLLMRRGGVLVDIGCGIHPQQYVVPAVHVCCEPCEAYLAPLQAAMAGQNDRKWMVLRATWAEALDRLPDKSVDSVFLVDVIEHLPKEEGRSLLARTLRVARRQVAIFTPLGFLPQEHPDGMDAWGLPGGAWQNHLSGWTPDDFDGDWHLVASEDYHREDNGGRQHEEPYGAFWAIWSPDVAGEGRMDRTAEDRIARAEQLLEQGGDEHDAIDLLFRALEHDPARHDAWNDLACVCAAREQGEVALTLLRKARQAAPGMDFIEENYQDLLQSETAKAWEDSYCGGGARGMGDHRPQFYHRTIEEMGFYRDLHGAPSVLGFGPGIGEFFGPLSAAMPEKPFALVTWSAAHAADLRRMFPGRRNLRVHHDAGGTMPAAPGGVAFSFLACQTFPRTLWQRHLGQMRAALGSGGVYYFQFAWVAEGSASDVLAHARAGSMMYMEQEMRAMVEAAGFAEAAISRPIDLTPLRSPLVWYLCRAAVGGAR